LKDEEAIDWCKSISKLSLDKGNKLKEGHGGLPRKRFLCVGMGRRKKRRGEERRKCEKDCFFLVLMCGEVLMGSGCVRI
jgi:hypothetical protein